MSRLARGYFFFFLSIAVARIVATVFIIFVYKMLVEIALDDVLNEADNKD